jgi:hypothetical protein
MHEKFVAGFFFKHRTDLYGSGELETRPKSSKIIGCDLIFLFSSDKFFLVMSDGRDSS